MRNSDTVLAVVLGLAGREEAMTTERLKRVRVELAAVLSNLDAICEADDNGRASWEQILAPTSSRDNGKNRAYRLDGGEEIRQARSSRGFSVWVRNS